MHPEGHAAAAALFQEVSPTHTIVCDCACCLTHDVLADVMKSAANLVPDLLARSHVLLYQGQFDAECGVASNEAWIYQLAW